MDDGRVNGHIISFVVLFLSRSRQIITPCGRGVDTGRIYINIYYVVKLMRNESVVEARDPLEEQVRRATVTAAAAE